MVVFAEAPKVTSGTAPAERHLHLVTDEAEVKPGLDRSKLLKTVVSGIHFHFEEMQRFEAQTPKDPIERQAVGLMASLEQQQLETFVSHALELGAEVDLIV